MTATLPRLLVEWIDRSHALVSLHSGASFPVVCDAGWRTVGGPDDTRSHALFEDLLGDLQERC
jgi:hypothetical protein